LQAITHKSYDPNNNYENLEFLGDRVLGLVVSKKLYMDNLEVETIKIFSKLASTRSKSLLPTTKNTTISFTFGNWALPYLKLLKKIGIAK